MVRERFAGQATLARLETPLVIYRSERHPAALYDLTQAPPGETREVPNQVAGLRSAGPAPASGPLFPAQRQSNAEGR